MKRFKGEKSWWDKGEVTKANFVETIVAYVGTCGEINSDLPTYQHNMIAHAFWDAYFPNNKLGMTWYVCELIRQYELPTFKDKKWVKEYFDWLYKEMAVPLAQLEEIMQ